MSGGDLGIHVVVGLVWMLLLLAARREAVAAGSGPRALPEDEVNATGLEARLAGLEAALESLGPRLSSMQRQVVELEQELTELRALATAAAPQEAAAEVAPVEPARPVAPAPPAEPAPPVGAMPRVEPARSVTEAQTPPVAAPPPAAHSDVDLAELLGARALAWAGGFVTVLGVVFFFVLAVDRGWIGPMERVGLGALASATLLVAGVVVRRRYGNVYSAFAAAGAGIAGGYATLLAAAALYGLLGDLAALLLAAAIATAGAALALAWRAQTLAAIGLVGATLVPLTLFFEGGLSVVGTGFVAFVFAATAVVAIRYDWRPLLAAGLGASALQIWILVVQSGEGAGSSVLALAAVFAGLYLSAGVALERRGGQPLERLAATLVLASAALAGSASTALLNGMLWGVDREGAALLGAAGAYGVVAALLFGRPRGRDVSALVGALALGLATIGLANVLAGTSLAVAWAAQAAVLAWLGGRIGDSRYRLLSLAYLVLALGYALVVTAPPNDLFERVGAPASGVVSVLAVALAALVVARYGRHWEGVAGIGAVSRALDALTRLGHVWGGGALWLAPVLGVYALSLVALELTQGLGVRPSFAWGHVAVTATWAGGGGLALLAGIGLARRPLQLGGLAWLAAALLKVTLFDIGAHAPRYAAWSALALGLGYAAASYGVAILRRQAPADVALISYGGTLVSGALVLGAVTELVPRGLGLDPRGSALLAAAAGYAALGATLLRPQRRTRDAVTTFWGVALVQALVASFLLLDSPTALVATWAAGAATLALLVVALRERRLLVGSAALAGLALGRTLIELAPPSDLFVPATGAADGVPALALTIGAIMALVLASARVPAGAGDRLDDALDRLGEARRGQALVAAAVLGTYALSLSILGLAQLLGGSDLTADFQRGHTAVSAFWGLIGLLALRFGLTRRRAPLKLAGFALFGAGLAKLFLYDLTMLSSVTRALSFLAVGAVLLVAGFFYQRLGARAAEAG